MGCYSIVIIDHDQLQKISESLNFGKHLVDAIEGKRKPDSWVNVSPYGNAAVVVGNYSRRDKNTQILIVENGTPWMALGHKPYWSKLTKETTVLQIFGRPVSKKK